VQVVSPSRRSHGAPQRASTPGVYRAAADRLVGRWRSRSGPAFSLVELLIVIAIIAILAALLMPALTAAKLEGKRIGCQNNLRELVLGVQLYTADNDGKLPDNNPGSTNDWVRGNLRSITEATNQVLLRQGKLFPYASHPGVYRCPADTSRTNGCDRVRSYSMNGWVGSRYYNTSPRRTDFRTFVRESEMAAVGAANLWLVLDEHEVSIDDGWFPVTMDDSRPFGSFPAMRHERGYDLNFGDGHVETYKLRDPSTLRLGSSEWVQIDARNPDWIRLKQVTTTK